MGEFVSVAKLWRLLEPASLVLHREQRERPWVLCWVHMVQSTVYIFQQVPTRLPEFHEVSGPLASDIYPLGTHLLTLQNLSSPAAAYRILNT